MRNRKAKGARKLRAPFLFLWYNTHMNDMLISPLAELEEEKQKKIQKKRKKWPKPLRIVLWSLLGAILVAGTIVIAYIMNTPRARLLWATVHFASDTLEDQDYLLYNIDIMELVRLYANADTAVEGSVKISDVKGFNLSIKAEMTAERSMSTNRLASTSTIEVLGQEVASTDIYAEGDTVYLISPDIDDLAFAFPTGIDLFMRMPDFTSDIDQQWFSDNKKNIYDCVQQIGLEETGNTIMDTNGRTSEEYVITIPEGCGGFIWELLGMDAPDYDVVVSIYLRDDNRIRRVEMDLSHQIDGLTLVMDGVDMGTCYLYMDLPDDEQCVLQVTRNSEKNNLFDMNATYYTNSDKEYHMISQMRWVELEDGGFELKIEDGEIKRGNVLLASLDFNGTVTHLEEEIDPFDGITIDLNSLEELDWKAIRDDVDTYVNDALDKFKESVGL